MMTTIDHNNDKMEHGGDTIGHCDVTIWQHGITIGNLYNIIDTILSQQGSVMTQLASMRAQWGVVIL